MIAERGADFIKEDAATSKKTNEILQKHAGHSVQSHVRHFREILLARSPYVIGCQEDKYV